MNEPGQPMPCLLPSLLFAWLLVPLVPARAQVVEIHDADVRPVGYTLGDLVPRRVEILVEPGWRLRTASLPAPGPQAYWLELRELRVAERETRQGRRYAIELTYQSFYAPIQALERSLPGFELEFEHGEDRAMAPVPPWTFTMSPLREVRLSAGGEGHGVELRPDVAAEPVRLAPLHRALWAGLAGTAALWLLLAWHHAWPPFHVRPRRPFAQAARTLRRMPAGGDASAYRERLRHLHRAFDAAAGRRLLADDVEHLIGRYPRLVGLRREIERFFQASRLAFFGADAARAQALLPVAELTAFGARLAAAERRP